MGTLLFFIKFSIHIAWVQVLSENVKIASIELEKFITQTLLEITEGIDKANQASNRFQLSGKIHERGTSGEFVEFDIGLEISHTNESGLKGGIRVASVGIGGEASASENYSQTNRLKFKVFVTEK